jgi:hypothetical protein
LLSPSQYAPDTLIASIALIYERGQGLEKEPGERNTRECSNHASVLQVRSSAKVNEPATSVEGNCFALLCCLLDKVSFELVLSKELKSKRPRDFYSLKRMFTLDNFLHGLADVRQTTMPIIIQRKEHLVTTTAQQPKPVIRRFEERET